MTGEYAREWNHAIILFGFFFSSRRRHTRFDCDWSSDVCSSDLRSTSAIYAAGALPDPADQAQAREALARFAAALAALPRSEERRVGKECRCRGPPDD